MPSGSRASLFIRMRAWFTIRRFGQKGADATERSSREANENPFPISAEPRADASYWRHPRVRVRCGPRTGAAWPSAARDSDAARRCSSPTLTPTDGLRRLLDNVCRCIPGKGGGGQPAHPQGLDSRYGGGRTHALIALDPSPPMSERCPRSAKSVDLLPASNGKGSRCRV